MFIELTDHLRCTAAHDESFLVLVPSQVEQRSVRGGVLGCPVCDRRTPVRDGIAWFDGAPEAAHAAADLPPAEALHAFLGLSGPGGYAVLAGDIGARGRELAALAAGVAFVAVNPPADVADAAPVLSVLRAPILPLRARSMRGVLLGTGLGGEAAWVQEAVRVTLPGLRVAGRGATPSAAGLAVLAEADGWWVAQRTAGA